MQLTSVQKEMVARFLRMQDEKLDDLPAETRVHVLSQIKQRVREELVGLNVETVNDFQVISLLKRMKVKVKSNGSVATPDETDSGEAGEVASDSDGGGESASGDAPDAIVKPGGAEEDEVEAAATIVVGGGDVALKVSVPDWKLERVESRVTEAVGDAREGTERDDAAAEDSVESGEADVVVVGSEEELVGEDFGERHWLGVCCGLANRTGQSTELIRGVFLLGGCFTGPFAVIVYLALYGVEVRRNPDDVPAFDSGVLGSSVFRFVGVLVSMFAAAWLLDFGVASASLSYFGQLPELGAWDRMGGWNGRLFVSAVVVLGPLSVLSGLPLAYRWGSTWSAIVHAGLAIYAVLISIGLAFTMVGYVLGALTQIAG